MRLIEAIGRLLGRLRGGGESDLPPHLRVGIRGEREAARHLKSHGYRILERNFGVPEGEIDLIAFRDGVLAFVEVRAQTQPAAIDPLLTITRLKQGRLVKAAHNYMALHNLEDADRLAFRFDVVAVLFDRQGRAERIEHVEGAFQESAHGF